MTPRRLSRGAAVVLMTTALAWNLPAAAQIAPASDGGPTAVTSKPEAAPASVPPAAAAGQPGPGERSRGGTFGGGRRPGGASADHAGLRPGHGRRRTAAARHPRARQILKVRSPATGTRC